jgi:CRP/FNR family transcriptional regulator, cyclic AMP receptor protein
MPGATSKTTTDENDLENSGAVFLPCLSALHAIPGFDRVSQKQIYPKGSAFLVEGQAPRGVFVMCAGRAKLSFTSAQGKKLIVRIARPGDVLGLQATLAGHPYEATAETLSPSRVDFISRENLFLLLERNKFSGLSLAVAISNEFTEFIEHARMLLLSDSASERLAKLLLRLGDEFGERTATGIRLHTSLTHEEIAQMIGSSRETVTRVLGEFKRKRMISFSNSAIVLHNLTGLESVIALRKNGR